MGRLVNGCGGVFLQLIFVGLCAGQTFDTVRDSIQDRIRAGEVPSVAVAVASRGTVLWEEGFGWADVENQTPATAHTIYSVASITKPFTATALMTLVESGKVALDAPVDNYLGRARLRAMTGVATEATVRRVTNHTSGLPLYVHFFYGPDGAKPPRINRTIRRYGILVAEPGEVRQYSNLGYGILGRVIEKVAAKEYANFMEETVFGPLGLRDSSIGRPLGRASVAVRYDRAGKPVANYTVDHIGASELWASAHDLMMFGMFHTKSRRPDQEQILTDASIDAMQTPGTGVAAGSGIGWNVGEAKGYKVIAHGGDMEGVTSLLLTLPSEQLVVAVVCNTRADVPGPVVDDIIEVLLPGWKTPPESQTPSVQSSSPEVPNGVWRGSLISYAGKSPFRLTISDEGATRVRLGHQQEVPVRKVSFDGQTLSGEFDGFIDTPDARKEAHVVAFSFRFRNPSLSGPATAFTRPPSGWMGNALTSWVELSKQP